MTARTTTAPITISTIAVVLMYGSFPWGHRGCAGHVPVARWSQTRDARADERLDLALRRHGPLLGRVQHRRSRDRLLPEVRRGGAARARPRLRHGQAAASVPPRRVRRGRQRRVCGHARALPGGGGARRTCAEPVRAAEARARPAAHLP